MRHTRESVQQILDEVYNNAINSQYLNKNQKEEMVNPRVVVKGEVEGYFVDLYLYDGETVEELGEVGIVQSLVAAANEHGIYPARNPESRSGNAAKSTGAAKPAARPGYPKKTARKSDWECPVHGSANVREGNYGVQCFTWKTYDEDAPQPKWAKDKIAVVNGVERWYCKYRPSKDDDGEEEE